MLFVSTKKSLDVFFITLKATRRTIVFTEGPDARILEATDRLLKDDLMDVILIGNVDEVKAAAEKGQFLHLQGHNHRPGYL